MAKVSTTKKREKTIQVTKYLIEQNRFGKTTTFQTITLVFIIDQKIILKNY